MGRVGKLLSFVRRTVAGKLLDEAKVDTGGGAIHTVQHYADPGDDSQPLPGDFPFLAETGGAGEHGAVGWHDTTTPRKAGPGEKRIYARSAAGTASVEFWMKASGEVHLEVFTVQPMYLKSLGPVIVDSPDIRVGDETASQPLARVGDLVAGSVNALSGAPGSPILPLGGAPTATGGVPFVGQIISGSTRGKG